MKDFRRKAREELLALIPPSLFFFIALHIVVLIKNLMLEGTGVVTTTSISIALAAIILGKAVLVADLLPFINRYPQKPLVYNVVWKTSIYFIISMLIHYIEIIFELWRKNTDPLVSINEYFSNIVWAHFLALQILLAVLIFMYCTTRELVRVIGPVKVWHIFFGSIPDFFARRDP
jgi:hypothetical protein